MIVIGYKGNNKKSVFFIFEKMSVVRTYDITNNKIAIYPYENGYESIERLYRSRIVFEWENLEEVNGLLITSHVTCKNIRDENLFLYQFSHIVDDSWIDPQSNITRTTMYHWMTMVPYMDILDRHDRGTISVRFELDTCCQMKWILS